MQSIEEREKGIRKRIVESQKWSQPKDSTVCKKSTEIGPAIFIALQRENYDF